MRCPAVLIGLMLAVVANAADSVIGQKIDDFRLQDFQGGWHALKDIDDGHLVVVAFLGTECPLAKLYAPRLATLSAEYADKGVDFVAIDSNSQDSVTELAHYARTHGIEFPLLKDVGNKVADAFHAKRTPEIFVLDRDRVIRYHGRVDDQYGVGFIRPETTRSELKDAIDELLAGKPVSVAETPTPGCLIGRVHHETGSTAVTYSKQISRILQTRCVECHREGEIAPFTLTDYEDVAGWADMIVEVIQDQRMPPWHASPKHGDFVNDARMPDEEKQMIVDWVNAGVPEGDPKDLPEPHKYAVGWRIPEPDLVLDMPMPYDVPAEGEIPYQYFVLDPKTTEDKWIVAAQCVAGDPAVVHHIIAFVLPPELAKDMPVGHFSSGGARPPQAALMNRPSDSGRRHRPDRDRRVDDVQRHAQGLPGNTSQRVAIMRSWFTNYLVAMAPGTPPMILNGGMAKRLPAGSKIVFQMHYTPNGAPRKDLSRIGLVFTDESNVKHEIVTRSILEQQFEIPPHDPNYEVDGTLRFREDTLLVEMFPHMHLRGKSFTYTARYPDGSTEVLLDVPRYDFGWQNIYTLREPKLMPRGTVLECVAHFDNSEENLSNPDPGAPVRFGDQTWEEMMIGFFNMTRVKEGPYRDPNHSRSELFAMKAKSGEVAISSALRERARVALSSSEAFDLFWDEIAQVVPQLDRADVSLADGLTMRFAYIDQAEELPSTFKMKQLPGQLSALGPALGLYQYAIGRKTVVNDSKSQTKGVEMQFLSRILPSSVHIPTRCQGKAAAVNFWSMDPDAFSPEAVAFLEQIAEIMTDGNSQANAGR